MITIPLLEALFARLSPVYGRLRCFACDMEELRSSDAREEWVGVAEGPSWCGAAALYNVYRRVELWPTCGVFEIHRGPAPPTGDPALESLGSEVVAAAIRASEQSKSRLSLGTPLVAVLGLETVLLARLSNDPLRWQSEIDVDAAVLREPLELPGLPGSSKKPKSRAAAQQELAIE